LSRADAEIPADAETSQWD